MGGVLDDLPRTCLPGWVPTGYVGVIIQGMMVISIMSDIGIFFTRREILKKKNPVAATLNPERPIHFSLRVFFCILPTQ